MYRVETPYVDKLVALKYLALSLSKTSPEFLIDQKRFLLELSYTFSQYFITCLLTDIRREFQFRKFCCRTRTRISNMSCFIGFLWSLGNQYKVRTLS